jgi:hypothetical protein
MRTFVNGSNKKTKKQKKIEKFKNKIKPTNQRERKIIFQSITSVSRQPTSSEAVVGFLKYPRECLEEESPGLQIWVSERIICQTEF